jgi:hypothetical protein
MASDRRRTQTTAVAELQLLGDLPRLPGSKVDRSSDLKNATGAFGSGADGDDVLLPRAAAQTIDQTASIAS